MKTMKKLSALFLVLAMTLSFGACGAGKGETADKKPSEVVESPASEKTAAEKFVSEKGESIEKQVEGNEENLNCEITSEGNKIVISVLTAEVDGFSDSDKNMFQQIYDAMKDQLKETVFELLGNVDGVDGVAYRICNSNGDMVAELEYEI